MGSAFKQFRILMWKNWLLKVCALVHSGDVRLSYAAIMTFDVAEVTNRSCSSHTRVTQHKVFICDCDPGHSALAHTLLFPEHFVHANYRRDDGHGRLWQSFSCR